MKPSLLDRLFVLLLTLLPHHLLSRGVHWLTRLSWVPFKELAIRQFTRLFRVDMSQAVSSQPESFPHFNAFFTRALQPDARPLCGKGELACPSDGRISAFGSIRGDLVFQAKGMDYSLAELLGTDEAGAAPFLEGEFATIYLSPRDYHRVHMPLTGTLREMRHVPGRLFSVNAATARTLPRLFTRNERVVCLFDTEAGPMAMVLVGAIFVGCMDTVWAGTVAPADLRTSRWHYGQGEAPIQLQKGAEMGRFNMGSTVILIMPKGSLQWQESLASGTVVRMGEGLARL